MPATRNATPVVTASTTRDGSMRCRSRGLRASAQQDEGTKCTTTRYRSDSTEEFDMLRAGILWFMGVPLIVVILIWMFYF